MGEEQATKKSDPQGGIRTTGRHVGELTTGGALALLLISFAPEHWMNAFQQNLAGIVLTALFSTIAKELHKRGILGDVVRNSIVLIAVLGLGGCAGQLGKVEPNFHTGADGETIVACSVAGVTWSFGDADVCRNVEGGRVSKTFSDMVLGVIRTAGAAVAGIFSGFGQVGTAMSAAIAPIPSETSEPAPRPPTDTTLPDWSTGSGVTPALPDWAVK